MSFVLPVLLGGLVFAAIPVLIHLIMRQKPKTLPFPAFRFLLLRHKTNVRKLRLRHLLLLALRIFLIAALCLALARPRLFHEGFGLSSERPVAAVLVFDTSMSMEYRSSDKLTRLDEARKRGVEFLDQLPEGSRVAILETQESPTAARGEWLTNMGLARERIKLLALRPAAVSLMPPLEHAYRMLGDLARSREDDTARHLPRLVCVFSDRTRGCWDPARLSTVHAAADAVPTAIEGLGRARGRIQTMIALLKELRTQMPPGAGRDYPEQAIIDALEQLSERISSLDKSDFPLDERWTSVIETIQRRGRDLLAMVMPEATKESEANKTGEYQAKLVAALRETLQDLRGARGLFVDVGLDEPVDLALVNLEFPRRTSGEQREVFRRGDKFIIKAHVRALGKDFSTMLRMKLEKQSTMQHEVALKAGQQEIVPFEIDTTPLEETRAHHSLEVSLATGDLLPFNNQRYATFEVRQPRQVLVIAEDAKKAERFLDALRSNGFEPEIKTPQEATALDALPYHAAYLFQVGSPQSLWKNLLQTCVKQGIGVGIVPPSDESARGAYNAADAKALMPASLEGVVAVGKDGVERGAMWSFDDNVFQHPLMAPYRHWESYDVRKQPREAFKLWKVVPYEQSVVVVPYREPTKTPAIVERRLGKARVLLFTTTFDQEEPRWSNFLERVNSSLVVMLGLSTNYLAGTLEESTFNFTLGKLEPFVRLPPGARYQAFTLSGPNLVEQAPAPETGNILKLKQIEIPGRFSLSGVPAAAKDRNLAAFSVNIPGEESDLGRVPVHDVEAVLGSGAVTAHDRNANIRDMLQGHWSEPFDLFPPLMVAVLLVLALENLLANKFYKKEEAPA